MNKDLIIKELDSLFPDARCELNYSKDYEVLMLEVENVGYDATGKKIEGSELEEVALQIREFIIQN